MRHRFTLLSVIAFLVSLAAGAADEKIIILNEGSWKADDGTVSYLSDNKVVSNTWFSDINGSGIGDTPNDIIQVTDNLIAIAVNWSDKVVFINNEGRQVGVTADIPNNRRLATDGKYVYVSSYGHECRVNGNMEEFPDGGFVAKIDISDFSTVAAVQVGWEPEGIAYYEGHLFVANTGGYSFQEAHDYEHTVNVIDAETMKITSTVDCRQINLYGPMAQSGQYLLIPSPGNYGNISAATIIFDCQGALDGAIDEDVAVKLDFASGLNAVSRMGRFYAYGASKSGVSQSGTPIRQINPAQVIQSLGAKGVSTLNLGNSFSSEVASLSSPYGMYVNPYTGFIYLSSENGALKQWDASGKLQETYQLGLRPAHFLALKPGETSAIDNIIVDESEDENAPIYNLQGIRVTNPVPGHIYIRAGRKFIMH